MLIVFTYGLFESPTGKGLGLRPLGDSIQSDDIVCTYHSYTEEDILAQIAKLEWSGKIMLVGHSLGGWRSIQLAKDFGLPIDHLVLLDPVPKDGQSPFNKTDFKVPDNVLKTTCFLRKVLFFPYSSPVREGQNFENHYMDLSHTDFCSNPEVQDFIKTSAKSLI